MDKPFCCNQAQHEVHFLQHEVQPLYRFCNLTYNMSPKLSSSHWSARGRTSMHKRCRRTGMNPRRSVPLSTSSPPGSQSIGTCICPRRTHTLMDKLFCCNRAQHEVQPLYHFCNLKYSMSPKLSSSRWSA